MAKAVKLTAKQQEVVNLMAAGWELSSSRDTFGGRIKGGASLYKSGQVMRTNRGIVAAIELAGVIAGTTDGFASRSFALTPLGKSLTTAVEKPKFQTWYYVERYGGDIGSQPFVSATEHTLTDAHGRKTNKHSDWRTFFETREQAVAEGRKRLERAVKESKERLADAEKVLAAFRKKEKLS